MTDVTIEIDDLNRDVLYARRVEMFFEPNEDGTESLNGKVVWHTEWWHYTGSVLRAKTLGPRIERTVEQILAEEYPVGETSIPAVLTIGSIKSAFIRHATESLGLGEVDPDPEHDPEPEPEE